MNMPQSEYELVIVGSGLAGYTLAREYRKLNPEASLLIVTRDDGVFYSKPMLSNAIATGKTPQQLVMKSVEQMIEELNADIWMDTEVSKLLPDRHKLITTREEVTYQQLVLATGAMPRGLPLQGSAVQQVISVNDLTAYREFRQQIEGKQRVAIIGPGLVGCEFANDLLRGGYEVHVIGPDEFPLSTLIPREAGVRMQSVLQDKGFHWHLNCTVNSVDESDSAISVSLSDGSHIEVDYVLSAVGLVPSLELAKQAGLQVNRGIVTDRRLACSAPDIYALGDCAEVAGLWLPFVMPIMNAARALAKNLNQDSNDLIYPPMPVVVKTPDFPLVVSPPRNAEGQWQIEQQDGGLRALFLDAGGALLGFVLTEACVKEKQSLSKQLPAVLD